MKKKSEENKICKLYIDQENQINKYYSDKEKFLKKSIDLKKVQFNEKHFDFKLFCTTLSQYSEVIQKNMNKIQTILSNFSPIAKSHNKNLVDLLSILTIQYEAEEEKYERLNLSSNFQETNSLFEQKGIDITNSLNNYYNEYTTLMEKLKKSHINYLKHFYEYEINMIKEETKEIKEIDDKNLKNIEPKKDMILVSLKNKESTYKNNLDNANKELKNIYNGINKCFNDLNELNQEMENIMETYLTNIYLGFGTNHKIQKILEEKIQKINSNNNNKIGDKINNEKNEKEDKILYEEIEFKSYNLISPFANIEIYKYNNKILEKLKPEVIYKISCMINSEFNYIQKEDIKEQYKIMDVKLICQRIIDSTDIKKEEEEQFYQYLEERKYMLAFLSVLNKTRVSQKCKIQKRSMIILGNAYKIIVGKLYKENNIDFDILKYLIIMSQTYYALGINGKDKIYLIRFIDDSPYFQSENLWNVYISQVIDKELDLQQNNNIWELESEEREEYKMSQIYFGKFISFAQNLIEFRLEKNLIYKIIHNLINTKYHMQESFIKQIDSIIENTNYTATNKFDPEKDLL